MSARTKRMEANRKRHDRSAMMQWITIGLLMAVVLVAILVFTDAGGSGGHSGFVTVFG